VALNILLADDSMTAQNMGKKILVDAGYNVVAVSNGAAAIKKIASDRPDIIILDVYMPGYTGLEVCERVKGAVETSRIPVLLTVGKMEPFKPEEANRVRADGVMIKPFEATDLIAAIQNIAKKITAPAIQQQAAAAPATPPAEPVQTGSSPSHVNYEDTILLTPEQVRVVQDKDFGMAEETSQEPLPAAAEARAEMPVFVPELQVQDLPIENMHAIFEQDRPAMTIETESSSPAVPALDASESPIARAMAETVPGREFFAVAPPEIEVQSDAHLRELLDAAPAMFVADEMLSPEAEPVFTLPQSEPANAELPVMPVEAVTEPSAGEQSTPSELETSAPVVAGPVMVSPAEELDTTAASSSPEVVYEAVPELEINSPIHLQEQIVVATDPALVTNEEDLSRFTTSFGQAAGEEVHVGIVSDLSDEQFAALTAVPATTPIDLQPEAGLQPSDAITPEAVTPEPEPSTQDIAVEFSAEPAPENQGNVLDEVGTVAPQDLAGTAPMVAYVPGIHDTQPLSAYTDHLDLAPVPEAYLPEEPGSSITLPEPAPEVQPVVAAEPSQEQELPPTAEPVIDTAAAVAAAAGTYVFTHEDHASEVQPSLTESSPEEAVTVPLEEAQPEAIADVSLETEPHSPMLVNEAEAVEEAALAAVADPQQQTAQEPEAAITSVFEPAADAVAEQVAGSRGIPDEKLSEAVARALERLRPQLISEIVKELTK
jgi:CheY-like chemotaxis protein